MLRRILPLLVVIFLILSAAAFADSDMTVTAFSDITKLEKHGNTELDYSCDAFLSLGYQYGDVVSVSFLDQVIVIPFCSSYSDVDTGCPVLLAREEDENIKLAINMGDFATSFGLGVRTVLEDKSYVWNCAGGVENPIQFTITLQEAGGYLNEYEIHRLTRSNEREDYAELSDEEFANFRVITTTGMGEGRLYRSSSPIDPQLGRSRFADAAAGEAGVTVVMNLCDSAAEVADFEGYDDTYCSTVSSIPLFMSMDVGSADSGARLAEGLRFFIENQGVYLIHCLEGKDRTGFVCAVLECLMGATYDEICADYMATYTNFYGVSPDEARYETILNGNIVRTLSEVFAVKDLTTSDLAACAETYLAGIGLNADEIAALKACLSR